MYHSVYLFIHLFIYLLRLLTKQNTLDLSVSFTSAELFRKHSGKDKYFAFKVTWNAFLECITKKILLNS